MSKSSLFAGLRSVIYATGFVALWAWLALATRELDGVFPALLPGWCRALGWVLLAPGAFLVVVSVVRFVVRGEGTPLPLDAPRRVVADGPYRWVRNPMYVGGFTVLAAFALLLRSPAMLTLAGAWWLGFHALVVGHEEPVLRRRFGVAYDEYRRRVPRWIPRRPLEG
jgi:protein-S-isoprenylcysteine O-methyltransferase Ste14